MIPILHKGRKLDLRDPLFIELINCATGVDREMFEEEYGELCGPVPFATPLEARTPVALAERLRETAEYLLASNDDALAPGETASRGAFLRMTNMLLLQGVAIQPRLVMNEGSTRFVLEAPNLAGFMALEVATAVEVGAKIGRCKAERHGARCEKLFLHGPLTGRRSDREYCSDRCRLIALRERNASKGG